MPRLSLWFQYLIFFFESSSIAQAKPTSLHITLVLLHALFGEKGASPKHICVSCNYCCLHIHIEIVLL